MITETKFFVKIPAETCPYIYMDWKKSLCLQFGSECSVRNEKYLGYQAIYSNVFSTVAITYFLCQALESFTS